MSLNDLKIAFKDLSIKDQAFYLHEYLNEMRSGEVEKRYPL